MKISAGQIVSGRSHWFLDKLGFFDPGLTRPVIHLPNEGRASPIPGCALPWVRTGKGSQTSMKSCLMAPPHLTGLEDNRLYINPMTLKPGEMEIVLKRLTEILEEK